MLLPPHVQQMAGSNKQPCTTDYDDSPGYMAYYGREDQRRTAIRLYTFHMPVVLKYSSNSSLAGRHHPLQCPQRSSSYPMCPWRSTTAWVCCFLYAPSVSPAVKLGSARYSRTHRSTCSSVLQIPAVVLHAETQEHIPLHLHYIPLLMCHRRYCTPNMVDVGRVHRQSLLSRRTAEVFARQLSQRT
jgi:hypothetical protein